MKYCPRCEEEKEKSEFSDNPSKKDGLNDYCKPCQRKYRREYYQRNKEKVKAKNKRRRQKLSEWLQRYKGFLSCERCGFDEHPAALDFHHKNSEDKYKTVARMVSGTNGIERIKEEIRKCEVLCKNCHVLEHHGDRC